MICNAQRHALRHAWIMVVMLAWSGAALGTGLLHAAPMQARAPLVVNSFVDAKDASPGDGTCASASGACTLRAAVQEANVLAGPDQIVLQTGTYTLTLAGTDDQAAQGDLDVTGPLTITGALPGGSTINAGQQDRVFDVFDASLGLANMVLQNGKVKDAGGAIYNRGTLAISNSGIQSSTATDSESYGAGIYNAGKLTISNSSIGGNQAARGGGIYNAVGAQATIANSTFDKQEKASAGGALWNSGTMQVIGSTFTRNNATGAGGAIVNRGMLVVSTSTFANNVAYAGGAINQSGGSLLLEGSTLAGNAAVYGGGLQIDSQKEAVVTASTFSNNTASSGGGIYNAGGTLTLRNSTVSGNQAKQMGNVSILEGGGIWNKGSVTVQSSTLAENSAPTGSAVANTGVITFANSIVAARINDSGDANCDGAVASLGYNLDSGTACRFNQPGDISSANPKLGPLLTNGGPTQTHALLPGSPAVDHGVLEGCVATDQRSVARPQGIRCDIGAFELVPTTTPTSTPLPATASAVAASATPQAGTPTSTPLPATATMLAATATARATVSSTPPSTPPPPTATTLPEGGSTPFATTATPEQSPDGFRVLLPLMAK